MHIDACQSVTTAFLMCCLQTVENMMKFADKDSDGTIDFEEYKKIMTMNVSPDEAKMDD